MSITTFDDLEAATILSDLYAATTLFDIGSRSNVTLSDAIYVPPQTQSALNRSVSQINPEQELCLVNRLVDFLGNGKEEEAILRFNEHAQLFAIPALNKLMTQAFILNKHRFFRELFKANVKPDINSPVSDGKSLLHFACMNNDLEWVKDIVALQPNVNSIDPNGATPLHLAAWFSGQKVLEELIRAGAWVDLQDNQGRTALHLAAHKGNMWAVKFLAEDCKANIYLLDENGNSPLLSARKGFSQHQNQNNYAGIVASLFSKGAKLKELENCSELSSTSFELLLSNANGIQNTIYEAYEGLSAFYPICDHVADSLTEMPMDAYTFSKEELQQSLLDAHPLRESDPLKRNQKFEEILKKIKSGELTFIATGWKGHRVYLVFYKDYMAICNRGLREKRSTLELYKINPEQLSLEVLQKLELEHDCLSADGISFFYTALPQLLQGEKDPFCLKLEKCLASKPQKVGNCSMNVKGALRIGAAFLSILGQKHPLNEDVINKGIDEAYDFSKRWSTLFRLQLLNSYMNDELRLSHFERYDVLKSYFNITQLSSRDHYLICESAKKINKRQANPKTKIAVRRQPYIRF